MAGAPPSYRSIPLVGDARPDDTSFEIDTRAPSVAAPRAHVPALDGLRGIAILMVLAHDFNLLEEPEGTAGRLIGVALNAGWLGVQLFFVLSGFLITGILLDTLSSRNYLSAFLGRRALRIFPIYYAVLFAAFVLAPLVGRAAAGAEHQIWFWLYLANWAEPLGRSVRIFPHLWSLSIEEQFYLVWPLVVRWLRPRALLGACLSLVALAFVSRVLLRGGPNGAEVAYMFTICRVDALALGALAAVALRVPVLRSAIVARRALLRWYGIAVIVVTVFATKGAPRTGPLSQSFGYTLFAVAFALLVVDAALLTKSDMVGRIECSAPLRAVGRYSYAMYLFHTPLHVLVGMPLIVRLTGTEASGTHGIPFALAYFVCASAVTLLAAFASYHLLEKHFLALKRFIQPRGA